MEPENLRENWELLGDVFYETTEVYEMEWADKVLKNYKVVMAPYGGMIALAWDSRQLTRGQPKRFIEIYNAAGILLNEIATQYERITVVNLGWSNNEDLIVVTDIGSVYMYDFDGTALSQTSATSEIQDSRVIEAKVFPTYGGSRTGVALLTGSYRFYFISDVSEDNPQYKLMADVPGLDNPPSSWAVIPHDRSIEILVSNNNKLYLIDRGSCSPKYPQRMMQSAGGVIEMAVLYKTLDIALFSENGFLWVGSSDLQSMYTEFGTEVTNRPSQMSWCGTFDSMMEMSAAIILVWDALNQYKVVGVGTEAECSDHYTDTSIFVSHEIDGARVISSKSHELIRRVPQAMVDVFRVGSSQSGALLYDAQREFDQSSHKANDYMQEIVERNDIELAVNQCISAAACSTKPKLQKALLRAASYGKCFLANDSPEHFVDMCKTLRVLNEVQSFRVGIPLTYQQLHSFTIMCLIKRLVRMRLYYLALPIVEYLKIPEGQQMVLSHWAMDKVKRSKESDEDIADAIFKRVGPSDTISYASVANEAKNYGRTELAIKLLDYEPRSAEQVPALMRMSKFTNAIEKAIESGDMDLVHTVIVTMEANQTDRDFINTLKDYPVASSWYAKWCSLTDSQKLHDHFYTQDNFEASALLSIKELDNNGMLDAKIQSLESINRHFVDGSKELESRLTKEQIALLRRQMALQTKVAGIIGLNLNETINLLIQRALFGDADSVRKEFKISDKKFWWLKVLALAQTRNWPELEKFAKNKKSPIGYSPFVRACIDNNNKAEAIKYIERVSKEEQVEFYIDLMMPEKAAEIAKSAKSSDLLDIVLKAIGPENRVLTETINSFKNNL